MTYSVIFDMDGVIFDTEKFYLECCVPAAEKLGLEGMDEVGRQCIGLTKKATDDLLLDHYGQDMPLDAYYEEVSKIFDKRYEEEGFPVKPGVPEILSWLSEHQVPLALASSTRTKLVRRELKDAGFDGFFDIIIGGDMAERSKPAPDIFLKAAELLGKDPQECIVIEDSFYGIQAAHSAGMIPIMVPDLLPPDDEMREKAHIILPSLHQVLDYLKTLL